MADLRENYLPVRKHDLVDLCADDSRLSAADRPAFRDFCRILESVFHFEFHSELQKLKQHHAPFDPDADTVPLQDLAPDERKAHQAGLIESFERLLQAANYDRVAESTLEASLHGESLFKVRLTVDFDDFEELLLFRRGRTEREATVRTWGGLRSKTITFLNFSRVVLLVRFRPQEHFDGQKRRDLPFQPGATVIKMFRDVPAADLEMVFPNTAVRMKPLDKLLIGVPAAIGGILVVATKLLGTLFLLGALFAFWLGLREEPVVLDQAALVALAVGFGTFGAFIWKQVTRFKTRKILFLKALSESLYFKSLDNNAGVFHRLIDDAEEEEGKEAILAYWYLLTSSEPMAADDIDRGIEAWLQERTGRDVDFEVHDATAKLERLGLVTKSGDKLAPLPLAEAKAVLDRTWDGYFEFGAPTF